MAAIAYRVPRIDPPTITVQGSRGFGGDDGGAGTLNPNTSPPFFIMPQLPSGTGLGFGDKFAGDKSLLETVTGIDESDPFGLQSVQADIHDFFTEHQTDYIVGGIGLVLIFAGIFSIVQTVKPI